MPDGMPGWPNAGKPQLVDGQTVFDMTPSLFAEGIGHCLRAGARVVGGCCGTSGEHMRAVANLMEREHGSFGHP